MSQSLELDINARSNVPQAMDKAKSATVSFGKQVEDIQKKFSTGFKDIFLSFLGPMAILGAAIAYIGKLIADNQRKHAEANQAAIDGTNELMSAEDRYWARKQEREKKDKESAEQAKTTREEVTKQFIQTDPRGRQIYEDFRSGKIGDKKYGMDSNRKFNYYLDKQVQDMVQALIAEDAKNNLTPTEAKKSENFKGPEGFSNVVGVGSNPVMEAMNAQLEEAQKQTALLEKIASPEGGVPKDFTKDSK